jgi:hypothetical protein
VSAAATFDALWLADALQRSVDGGSRAELHTLAYLGCLLAVFDGRAPAWWAYRFTATRAGAPFAQALSEGVDAAEQAGMFRRRGHVLRLTDRGRRELDVTAGWPLNARRVRYLDAASATALAIPLPSVADALSFEPGLRRALRFVKVRALLDEAGLALLEAQFAALESALAQQPRAEEDLMVPAVVWLTYLAQERPADTNAA